MANILLPETLLNNLKGDFILNNFLSPKEIASYTVDTGIKKVKNSTMNLLLLGILAGAFIAFASQGSNMASYILFSKPETVGLGKALAGAIFGTGLMLVIIAGGELFTGNTLIVAGVLDKKVRLSEMLRNWFIVYIGNFIGSLFIAFMIVKSGQLHTGGNLLGGVTIKIASYKSSLGFMPAVYLGIMCNWLVCLAVWMSYGAKDIAGKILAIFFPIWLFITSGFEHSIANMYYIPAGILAKSDSALVLASGLGIDALSKLSWLTFITKNLIPVTLGNIIGGSLFVGAVYYYTYIKTSKEENTKQPSIKKIQ